MFIIKFLKFIINKKMQNFHAWQVTNVEMLVIVSYELDDVIVHDLFKSNLESYLKFELSLPNIQVNCDTDRFYLFF
jgi:hypothetical protein